MKINFSANVLIALTILNLFVATYGCASDETIQDFIFVAEIPVHISLPKPEIENDWIDKEKDYTAGKGNTVTPFQQDFFYEIKKTKPSEKTWRGRFTPYHSHKLKQQSQQNYLPNEIRSIIDLFRKQAFGCSDLESIEESERKMRIIVLANCMKSIFAFRNQPLKTIWNETEYSNVCFLRGAWEPKWVKKENMNSKGMEVTLKEVRQYMRFCLDKTINGTHNEIKKYKEILHRLIQQEKEVVGQVPYHELREYLRIAPKRKEFIQTFVNSHPQAILYEATHDSDLVGLRVQSDGSSQNPTGLYTHYQQILQDSTKQGKELPDVLTTGYRAAPDNRFKSISDFGWVYTAIEGERYVRAAAAAVDYRVAYIPEPNCLFRVPSGEVSIKESFCKLPTGKSLKVSWETSKKTCLSAKKRNQYAPCESPTIMVQRYANSKEKDKLKVFFDPTHPVFMKVPKRMLACESYSELGTYFAGKSDDHFNRSQDSDNKLLNFLNNIPQSCFDSLMQGRIIYRQFGLNRKKVYVGSFSSRVGRLVETLREWSEKKPDSCHRFLSTLACTDFNTFNALSEQDKQLRVIEVINRAGLQFEEQAIEKLILQFMGDNNTKDFSPLEFYKSLNFRRDLIKKPNGLFTSLYKWMLDMHILSIVNPVKSRGMVPFNLRCISCENDPTTLQFGSMKLFEQKENIRGIELAHSFFSSESRTSFFIKVFFDSEAKTFLYTRYPSEGEFPSWLKNSLDSFLYNNIQKVMNEIYGSNVGTILRRTAEEMGCSRQNFYAEFYPRCGSISQSKTSPKKAIAQLELSGYENPFINQPNLSAVEHHFIEWLLSLRQPYAPKKKVDRKRGRDD